MIAFLHTSAIHIDRFEKLVRKFDTQIKTKHFVNESLLQAAVLDKKLDVSAFNEQINRIKNEDPSIIICTCSSYGALCDASFGVYCIDQPIANYLVQHYKKIGLTFTANATKLVSRDLLYKTALAQNKKIDVFDVDCTSYWSCFENKDIDAYEKGIASTITSLAVELDVVFLAQASMEGANKYLNDFQLKVVSSPEYGIKHFITKLHTT